MSAFVLPTPVQTTEKLPAWALELAKQAVLLRQNKRHCMLVVRFDGLAWHILEAAPAVKVSSG
jgi:hypothetical protein